MSELRVYPVREVVRVVDGDTVDLSVDLGFHIGIVVRFRLLGVNAPESRTATGPAATEFVKDWCRSHSSLRVRTAKADSFGRWLAWLEPTDDGISLNEALLAAGHAVAFRG